MKSLSIIVCLVLAPLFFVGCGDDGSVPSLPMHTVTGTVTLDDQPLEKGSIVFDPADQSGTPVQGGIENGTFEFEAPAGAKTVRISAVRETDETDQYGEVVTESYIPAKYDSESELKADVTEAGPNAFEYKLKSE